MEYERRLGRSEIKWQYVYIDSKHKRIFPEPNKMFPMKVGGRELSVFIDKKQRIRTTQFKSFLDLREGDIVVFTKRSNGAFTLRKKIDAKVSSHRTTRID